MNVAIKPSVFVYLNSYFVFPLYYAERRPSVFSDGDVLLDGGVSALRRHSKFGNLLRKFV